MEMRVSSTLPRRNLRKSCYGPTKGYLTAKRSANGMRVAFVLSIKLFQNKQFHLVHIHTFHFSFCSHSGMQNGGIAYFTLSSGTDQSYKKPYFV